MTRSLLRALIAATGSSGSDIAARGRKPKVGATLQLLALLGMFLFVSGAATAIRDRSFVAGLVATGLISLVYGGLWLLLSVRLPHGDADWRELLPGAALVGVGLLAMQAVVAYYIAPQAGHKQSTYGSLGLAAALLLGLYIVGRLGSSAAVLNATLHARRTGAPPD